MNTAIRITTILIRATEEGIQLKTACGKLRYHCDRALGKELECLLKEYRPAIIERLNYDAVHPDPFKDFFDECCLFSVSTAMATPIPELDETYLRWAERGDNRPASLVSLHKRLRGLGCQEIRIHGAPWWEHIGLVIGWEQAENRK